MPMTLTPEEAVMVRHIPEGDLVDLAAELDMAVPEVIDRESLLRQPQPLRQPFTSPPPALTKAPAPRNNRFRRSAVHRQRFAAANSAASSPSRSSCSRERTPCLTPWFSRLLILARQPPP